MNVQMFDGRKRAKVTQSGNQTILIHGKSGTTEVPIKVDADGNVQTSDANAKTALDAIAANLVDAADATLHDKLDALLAYYKDAEQNTIHDKLDAMTTLLTTMSAQNPWPVTLSGNIDELKGLAADRPAAAAGNKGKTYWSIDTGDVSVSTGTEWRSLGVA